MMDDGESPLQEFLGAEEKRGHVCSLTDPQGPSYQYPHCALPVPTASRPGNATPAQIPSYN